MKNSDFQFITDEPNLKAIFPEQYSLEELDVFYEKVENYLQSRTQKPFTLFVDVSMVKDSSPSSRQRHISFFNKNDTLLKNLCQALALVSSTTLQRGALTALFWIKKTSWPTKIFTDKQKAIEWINTQSA